MTANSALQYVIHDQPLTPGAAAVTTSGTPISLAPSASIVIVGSSTMPLIGSPIPVVVNGHTITANSAFQYIVGGQTLTPGAPAVSISGTPVSIPASAQLSMTIGTQAYPVVVNSAGDMIVASQTIMPGGSPIIVGGETISEDPKSSELVVVAGGSTTTAGLGQIIAGALGKTASAIGSMGANASATGLTFTGGASGQLGMRSFSCAIKAAVMAAFVICFR